jgi:hypothetical protein
MSLEEIWKLLWCFFSNVWLIKKEKKKKNKKKVGKLFGAKFKIKSI